VSRELFIGAKARRLRSQELAVTGKKMKHTQGGDDLFSSNGVIEAEILHASLKAGTVAQIVIAVISVIGLLYLLKLVMVTTLVSVLLAFVLEPLVAQGTRIRIPRAMGALFAVALAVGLVGGLTYFFLQPSNRFRHTIAKVFRKDPFGVSGYSNEDEPGRKEYSRNDDSAQVWKGTSCSRNRTG
jgi:hypothetical protein